MRTSRAIGPSHGPAEEMGALTAMLRVRLSFRIVRAMRRSSCGRAKPKPDMRAKDHRRRRMTSRRRYRPPRGRRYVFDYHEHRHHSHSCAYLHLKPRWC